MQHYLSACTKKEAHLTLYDHGCMPQERYAPCGIDWYLERASVVTRKKDKAVAVLFPRGQVTHELLQCEFVLCAFVASGYRLFPPVSLLFCLLALASPGASSPIQGMFVQLHKACPCRSMPNRMKHTNATHDGAPHPTPSLWPVQHLARTGKSCPCGWRGTTFTALTLPA